MKIWYSCTIYDLIVKGEAELKTGPFGTQLHASDYVETGTPVINVRNIGFGNIKHANIEFISEETVQRLHSHLLKVGDIVFGRKGAVERHVLITQKYARWFQGSDCLRLRLKSPRIDPRFISYYFQTEHHKQWMINQCSHGSTMASLNQDIISRIPLYLPPLPTQRKIAAILSAYDDLIENNTRRIAILEEMAQSLYREWFVHFRYPGHEKNNMVESELGMIPEGWEATKLSHLVSTQYGYTESASEVPVGPKYLRGMDINKTSYIQWDLVPYCPISESDYPKYKLASGDIVVIRMADPGKIGIIEKEIDAVFASYLIRLQIIGASISPYYLFYFLNSERYHNYITGASTGTTRKSASAGVITDISLVIPPSDIVERFEQNIYLLRKMLNNLLERNAKSSPNTRPPTPQTHLR